MPLEERRMRHKANYAALLNNDLTQWAERFLGLLEARDEPVAEALPMTRRAGSAAG